jgi:hypothetical protein
MPAAGAVGLARTVIKMAIAHATSERRPLMVGLWALLNLMTFTTPALTAVMAAVGHGHDHLALRLLVGLAIGGACAVTCGCLQLRMRAYADRAQWGERKLPWLYLATVLVLVAATAVAVTLSFYVLRRLGLSPF